MENNIKLDDTLDLSEFDVLGKPWLDKIIIDLKKKLIMIEKTPDKDGDIELLCLEPDPLDENQCSISSGYRGEKNQYLSEGRIAKIPIAFDQILMSLQPLIASLPIEDK